MMNRWMNCKHENNTYDEHDLEGQCIENEKAAEDDLSGSLFILYLPN